MHSLRKLGIVTAVASFALIFPSSSSAHSVNQPPFVYINSTATGYYPVGYASLPHLNLPQDLSPVRPVVGEVVQISLDTNVLPILPEELSYLSFHWDFGDRMSDVGTSFQHTYTTAGPKLITLSSTDSRTKAKPQLLDTILINVLPNKEYTLPTPVISMNGVESIAANNDTLQADFSKKVTLDATHSSKGTSEITTYTWDLGDQQLTHGLTVIHSYNPGISLVNPVLRVTDSEGFYVDTIAQISNTVLSGNAPSTPSNSGNQAKSKTAPWIWGAVAVGLFVLAGAGLVLSRKPSGDGKKSQ